jgi:hypothetical protein
MTCYNVVHLSSSPLVGAPGKLSDNLNNYSEGYNSEWFIEKDYPNHLKGFFSTNAINLGEKRNIYADYLIKKIQNADIIHIHNFISAPFEKAILRESKKTVKFIYQVHSPLREGPIFYNYEKESKIPFDDYLVVGQYQPRLFNNFKMVPNFVNQKSELNLLDDTEKIKIIFSPTHKQSGGRWNDKFSKNLNEYLKVLATTRKEEIIVYNIEGMPPSSLLKMRTITHITIDEINTGAFHQVSLEGLSKGNVVINNADYFSKQAISAYASNDIPFYTANDFNIQGRLDKLISDRNLIRDYQQKSYDYYNLNLRPELLIQRFVNIYESVLNDNK